MSKDLAKTLDDLCQNETVLVRDLDSGKTYRVRKEYDEEGPHNPREDDDGLLGTMVTWHRRYTLGDEQPQEEPVEWLQKLLAQTLSGAPHYGKPVYEFIRLGEQADVRLRTEPDGGWVLEAREDGDWEKVTDLEAACTKDPKQVPDWFLDEAVGCLRTSNVLKLLRQNGVCILPLYLFDHTMLSMSTSDFGDRWDSGQVGWIYADKDKAEKLWCAPWDMERAETELEAEVKHYDFYLSGTAYWVKLETFEPLDSDADPSEAPDSDFVDADSCGGFEDAESMAEFVEETVGSHYEILDD